MSYVGQCKARVLFGMVEFGCILGHIGRNQIIFQNVWVTLVCYFVAHHRSLSFVAGLWSHCKGGVCLVVGFRGSPKGGHVNESGHIRMHTS